MKKYILSALMMLGLTAGAQTINFDTQDYKSVGVYDNWEQSPFRNGTLTGNAMVVDNPNTAVDPVMGEAPNPSAKVAAVQRSRFGSNTFGLRVNLNEPFRLTKENRFLHVMAYLPTKPESSRVMIMGLGKRVESDWSWQTGEDEQFWCFTTSKIEASESWQDLVFSFKGFSYAKDEEAEKGIDIYAIIIVPDVRSPHADSEDFVCYFDNIEINEDSNKRFSTDKYPLNIAKDQKSTRTDRAVNAVKLGTQSVSNDKTYVYNDYTKTSMFNATAGQTLSPSFDYTGSWMSGFVYVDWNNDGKFDFTVESDGKPSTGSEIVSYSASEISTGTWRNSAGSTVSNGNNLSMPTFTIPETQANGFYRMRYKVDWSSLDPAGNPDQDITANGGGIVDLMLDLHAASVKVSDQQLNGAIHTSNGDELNNYAAEYGKALTVKMIPAGGFTANGLVARYGYDIDNEEQYDANGNPRWFEKSFTDKDLNENNELTLPASIMIGGQMKLTGDFKSTSSYDEREKLVTKGDSLLKFQGVGYPTMGSEERTVLENAVNDTESTPEELQTAIHNFMTTANVELPEENGVYTFTAISKEGRKTYRTVSGWVDVNDDVVLPETAWYAFDGTNFTPVNGGDAETLTVNKMLKTTEVDVESEEDLFGYVTLEENSTYKAFSTPENAPYFTAIGNTSSVVFNWDTTCAYIMREVEVVQVLDNIKGAGLMALTEDTEIAIGNIANTNGSWVKFSSGERSCSYINDADVEDDEIFTWHPVGNGKFNIINNNDQYLQAASVTFGDESGAAEFTAYGYGEENFTGGNAFTTDGTVPSEMNPTAQDGSLVRFYKGDASTWYNCQAYNASPLYNTGGGAWTVFHVYTVSYNSDGPTEPKPVITPRTSTAINSIAKSQNGKIYDLQGRMVNNAAQRGIYIENNKKVLK